MQQLQSHAESLEKLFDKIQSLILKEVNSEIPYAPLVKEAHEKMKWFETREPVAASMAKSAGGKAKAKAKAKGKAKASAS